jgi:hypothetical protein
MTTQLDNLFVELSEAEMATTSGGLITSTFLDRWAARVRAGNPNLARISQRLVNEFYRGGLTPASISTWSAATSADNRAAWKTAAPLVSNFLNSTGSLAGATPAAVSAVRSYLNQF